MHLKVHNDAMVNVQWKLKDWVQTAGQSSKLLLKLSWRILRFQEQRNDKKFFSSIERRDRDNPEGINLLILKQIKDHEHILHSEPPHSWPNQLFFSDSCLCVVKLSATSLKACYHKNTFKRSIIWSHFSHFHSYMNSSNKNQV